MKDYRIVVSYGDGNPKHAVVKAKNGIEAHDQGFKEFPGARSIRVVGSISDGPPPPPPEKPHLFFGSDLTPKPAAHRTPRVLRKAAHGPISNRETVIAEAIRLRHAGLSYEKIGNELGVYRSTVRDWIIANT